MSEELEAEIRRLETVCDRLAASVILLAHDAHPVYSNTTGWRGGIGGQAMTSGCSIINPPPDAHTGPNATCPRPKRGSGSGSGRQAPLI